MTIMIPKENTTVVYCGVFCAFALFEFSPLFVLFFEGFLIDCMFSIFAFGLFRCGCPALAPKTWQLGADLFAPGDRLDLGHDGTPKRCPGAGRGTRQHLLHCIPTGVDKKMAGQFLIHLRATTAKHCPVEAALFQALEGIVCQAFSQTQRSTP